MLTLRATLRRSLVALALLSLSANVVRAQQILAENVATPDGGGLNSYSTETTIGAESFSLSAAYRITSISHVGWHAVYAAQPGAIDWYIYGANGAAPGTPGALLYSGTTTSYFTSILRNEYDYEVTRYSVALSDVALDAGNYWVGFHNVTDDGDPHWAIATTGSSIDGMARRSDDGESWSSLSNNRDFAFSVEGEIESATPEPSSLLLLGTGALSIAALGRRRRRRANV